MFVVSAHFVAAAKFVREDTDPTISDATCPATQTYQMERYTYSGCINAFFESYQTLCDTSAGEIISPPLDMYRWRGPPPIVRKLEGTQCLFCGYEFHSRKRLLHHIKYTKKGCKNKYMLLPDVGEDTIKGMMSWTLQ